MHYIGFQINSLKIDSLSKRWYARGVFLFVFAVYSIVNLWPLGDPDFSKVISWVEDYTELASEGSANIPLPEISSGNILYIASVFGLSILLFAISFFYTGLFLADQRGSLDWKVLLGVMKRLPVLLIFVFVLFVPLIIVLSIPYLNIFLLMLILPPVYLAPAIIVEEKKSFFESIAVSLKSTKGFKFSIFLNFMIMYSFFNIASWILSWVIHADTKGYILVSGFLISFLVLAVGRNIGIIYNIVKTFSKMNSVQ